MALQIGKSGWVDELRAITAHLGDDCWDGFTPCSADELKRLQQKVRRDLPAEFVEFYREIGCGQFKHGGGLYSPEEIIQCIGAPIYFILGSMTPGAEWCSDEEHRRLWLTRGAQNPAPERFTEKALTFGGAKLYDLLQVGTNGCSCYHQLHLGAAPRPFAYCFLTEFQTMEDVSESFSSGIQKMISFYSGGTA